MSEDRDTEKKEKGGFFKTIMSSAAGLLGGAALMYLSPLVNSAIKPPRPVPNFSAAIDGAQVTFHNRSTGGTQGWWDFGDGSALEPFSPNQASVNHKFPGPGTYTVKLALHNLIGEEAERAVPVRVDTAASAPTVDDFAVTPVTPTRGRSPYPAAPATFRISGNLKNVDLLLWCVDDHPFEIVTDPSSSIEHYVTFPSYGSKKIRLMAVSGKSKIERQIDVWVDVPDDDPTIFIQPKSFAVTTKTMPISVSFPAQYSGDSYPFEVSRKIGPDGVILEANLERPSDQLVRNARLTIAGDKKSFTVTGELLRQAGPGGVPASWFAKVDLKTANKDAASAKKLCPVSALLTLPGRTVIPMPANSGMAGGVDWEIRQGMDIVLRDDKVPASQVVRLRDRYFRVSVTPLGTQMQIDAVETQVNVPLLQTSSPRPN